MPLKPTGGADV